MSDEKVDSAPVAAPTPPTGAFKESLVRNNKTIRADRAEAIVEDAETYYKRRIEDDVQMIKKLKREQENMLDLSPHDKNSLMLASDFKAPVYVETDIKIGVQIRNLEIKIEIAANRYKYLFGKPINTTT